MSMVIASDSAPTTTGLWVVDTFSALGHTMTADKGITDAEYRLISAIKRHDWRDGICRASQADLGDHCAKDVRTVRRLVHTLKQKHLLEEINDPERPGRARVYRLLGSAATSPQTGQSWPVYDHAHAAQSGQGWPNKSARSGRLNRPHLAGLKKTPVKTPEDGIPEIPEGEVASPAPARETDRSTVSLDGPPRPVPKTQPLPSTPAPEPPPPPPPPRSSAKRGPRPRTDPPETLEPSPPLRAWALEHGFAEATMTSEVVRCLDHHRIEVKTSGNWQASLRTWLSNEVAWATADGRQPGVHVGKARPKTPAARPPSGPTWTGRPGADIDPDISHTLTGRLMKEW